MENWGCEFLDHNNYQKPTPQKPKLTLPLDLVWSFVDKNYIDNIRRKDLSYIRVLQEDISKNGQIEPLLINLGTNGIILADGNHRLCAMDDLGLDLAEVKIRKSDRPVKSGGVSYWKVIEELITNYERKENNLRSL